MTEKNRHSYLFGIPASKIHRYFTCTTAEKNATTFGLVAEVIIAIFWLNAVTAFTFVVNNRFFS